MNTLKSNRLDKIMMAITFAEAGEADTARDILNQKQQRPALRVRKETQNRPQLRV
jgi:hypothetical protein